MGAMKTAAQAAWLGLISAGLLAGCGGGGGGSGSSAQSATVAIALTDAPSSEWDEALATITRIELIGEPGRPVLFSGSETVDLLRLADYAELFTVADEVPIGTYSKIRLQLSDLELIDRDETGAIIATEHPKLAGNGKLDLNPQGPVLLVGGATVVITLDFDVGKSLKITETGSGQLILRPVVFVDITTNLPTPGLARVHGEVSEIDALTGSFRLCQTRLVVKDDDEDEDDRAGPCLDVDTDDATGIFGSDGLPAGFDSLVDGEPATVIGRLRPLDEDEADDDGDDDSGDDDRFHLAAVTVERGPLGTFRRVPGQATGPVDLVADEFPFDVAANPGPVPAGPITAQLYPKTRIFSDTGVELDRSDIVAGQGALLDAVPVLSDVDPDELRTALVVLRADAAAELLLRGTVVSVDTGTGEILVTTETGDRCVAAGSADVFLVEIGDDGLESARGSLADLEAGQELRIFGSEPGSGCFEAETILADADL